jgi:hypothetical protein
LHKFVNIYLVDVCVYSLTPEEQLEHLYIALQLFKEEGLKLRLKMCFFSLYDMEYLEYNVSVGKTLVSTKKVEAVADTVATYAQTVATYAPTLEIASLMSQEQGGGLQLVS